MIAARLLGVERFGLADLAAQFLGVTLEKGPQKADWARRPLTERMANYARNDTRHLQPLVAKLDEQLHAKGRWHWCEESCARLLADCAQPSAPDPETAWRLSGSGRFSRAELAILRELWRWREAEARATRRPPYFLLSHEALLEMSMAAAKPASVEPFLPRRFAPHRRAAVLHALARGQAVPISERPEILRQPQRHATLAERRRFNELKHRRDRQAEGLQIDPSLIASRATLENLARDGSASAGELMRWQRELLGL
jgi:ribonuclease D